MLYTGESRRTLYRRKQMGLIVKPSMGRPAFFNREQEAAIADRLIRCADACKGYDHSHLVKWLKEIAAKVVGEKDAFMASDRWAAGFLERNTHVALKDGSPLTKDRAVGFIRATVEPWQDEVEPIASSFPASETYNVDGTSQEFDGKPRKVRAFAPQRDIKMCVIYFS